MLLQGDIRAEDFINCPDKGRGLNATRTFTGFIYADSFGFCPSQCRNVRPRTGPSQRLLTSTLGPGRWTLRFFCGVTTVGRDFNLIKRTR